MDGLPIKGKCTWWRETLHIDDAHDARVKPEKKRVVCTCFVEGYYWETPAEEVPVDCPYWRHCRYHIRHG